MIDFSTATSNQLMIIYQLFRPAYVDLAVYDSNLGYIIPYRSEIKGIFHAVENELIERGVL